MTKLTRKDLPFTKTIGGHEFYFTDTGHGVHAKTKEVMPLEEVVRQNLMRKVCNFMKKL